MSPLPTERPALVALDVDGTLVTYEGFFDPPRPAVREAVARVVEHGSHVVIATGRSLHSTTGLLDALDLRSGYAVCSNGAVVIDLATRDVVHLETFEAGEPVRYFAEHVPDAVMAVEDHGVGFRVTGDFPVGELDGKVTVVTHDELLETPISRLVLRWPQGDPSVLRGLADAAGLSSVDYAIGYTAWLDVMPKGVSKASGLDVVCQRLGVDPRQTLAIGDGHNDLEMLAWAGHGVAMGQSAPDVLAAADSVCGSIEDDGAAQVLNALFGP